jgi:hypothetical protein
MDGNPGPYYVEWEYGGITHRSHSKVTGHSAATDVGNIPLYFIGGRDGFIDGVGGELILTAAGGSMNVTVAAGAAIVHGILYDRLASGTLTVSAAHATLTRFDRVIVEVVPRGAGADIEGRAELKLLVGTAAASPALPALTQTASLWQHAIGLVVVNAAVTTIASDKVSVAGGAYAPAIPNLYISSAMLASSSVTADKITPGTIVASNLADGAVTSAKILDGTIATADIADSAITLAKMADNAVGTNEIIGGSILTANIADGQIATAKIADLAVQNAKLGTNSVGTSKIADSNVTEAKLATNSVSTAKVVDGAITEAKLAAAVVTKLNDGYSGVDALMPISQYVASGSLSSGTRTLITLAVGPLEDDVVYSIQCVHGVTLRGTASTGTTAVRTNINGGTQASVEMQHVGGVPRWASVAQSAQITGTGATIDVTCSVSFVSGDPGDIRAGQVSVIAIPT